MFAPSPITIHIRQKEETAYVTVSGKMNSSASADLASALEGLAQKNISLDLKKVDYISSDCLRVLLMANKRCLARKGDFCILNPSPGVTEVFEMTGLSEMLVRH